MSEPSGAVPYHHGRVRELAIARGLKGLREQGDLPSLREIAADIGVTHRALYRHFADREDLVSALVESGFDSLAQAMEAVAGPDDGAHGVLNAYVRFALKDPDVYALMFSLPARRLMSESGPGAAVRRVIDVAAKALIRPGDTEQDTRDRVVTAWGLAHGLCALRTTGALRASDGEDAAVYIMARLAACGLV